MKSRSLLSLTVALACAAATTILIAGVAQADQPHAAPTVTAVHPSTAPNDLDTTVVITGTGFVAVPTVSLEGTVLQEVGWVSAEQLTATVPWGLEPGVYALTVENPGGESGSLADAFTVTQGIGVWTSGGPYGGHISPVRVNPHTPSTVYAIAATMGLLISADGAATWQPSLFNLNPPEQVSVDAHDPDLLYAGFANGFMRSPDGGSTWERLAAMELPWQSWRHYMVAHPSLPGVVYAATMNIPPDHDGGIHRSDDYGETWITLTVGLTDTQFSSLAIHAVTSDTLLAGTENGNLYYSLDAGATWTLTAQIGHELLGVYLNPYQPLEAWAAGKDAPHLFRSTDLVTWTPVVVDPGHAGGSHDWDMAFLTDTIWVSAWGVYTSTNGGADWTALPEAPAALSIAVHPSRPQDIYAGDFTHGVFKSADGGLTWQQSSDGLAGVNPSTVLVAPDDPETVYAKIDPSIVKSEDGGQTWRSLDFGQGSFPHRTKLAIDPFQPERLYFGYGTDDSARLWISDDGGEDPGGWISVTAALPLTYAGWNGRFYTLAPHPAVPGRILAGIYIWPPGDDEKEEGLLYGSDDYGLTWEHLGPTQPISWVTEIAFDSQDPDLIYAATQATGLWRSTDGGQSWAPTPNPGGIPGVFVVATHPEVSGRVYVRAHEEGNPDAGLFVSDDAGQTWTHLTWQVGDQLLFTPTQPPALLTGCGWGDEFGAGVCQSLDGGTTWEQLEGISFPTAMAAGTDGERVVVYIGTPGGMLSPITATVASEPGSVGAGAGEYSVMGGGVYRMTRMMTGCRVYLPVLLKGTGESR